MNITGSIIIIWCRLRNLNMYVTQTTEGPYKIQHETTYFIEATRLMEGEDTKQVPKQSISEQFLRRKKPQMFRWDSRPSCHNALESWGEKYDLPFSLSANCASLWFCWVYSGESPLQRHLTPANDTNVKWLMELSWVWQAADWQQDMFSYFHIYLDTN